MASSGVAPPSGGSGGAAAAVGNAALHGAQRGAAIAQKGVVNLTIYVQRNPTIVSALCCLAGVALSVISVLSIIGIAQMSNEENKWTPRDSMQMFYQFIFGIVLVLVDMKEPWANSFFGLQTKLFLYCNFLASQTGRACFYFYVGSISLFLLPSSEWMIVYIILGGWLCLLGLVMLGLRVSQCCCGNDPPQNPPTVGQATHVQS